MYDVIIAGAGPAGCAAANILSKKGFKVAIFEKAELPRDKSCGGGVAIRCKDSLDRLSVDIGEVSLQEYKGFNLSFNNHSAKTNLGRTIGWGVYRKDFDWLLAQNAIYNGARVTHKTVNCFEENDGIIRVSTDHGFFDTKILLAGDGINSVVRKGLGIEYDTNKIGVCSVCEVKTTPEKIEEFNDLTHLDFSYLQKGFVWAFPKKQGNTINVGVGGYIESMKKNHVSLNDILHRFVTTHNISDKIDRPHGALIPFGGTVTRYGMDNILLLGDAAGFASPLSGEGIPYALESGIIAADCVTQFFENQTPLLDNYTRNIFPLAKEINEYALTLQNKLFGSDSHRKHIVKMCATNEYVMDVISKIFLHIIPYEEGIKKLSTLRLLPSMLKASI